MGNPEGGNPDELVVLRIAPGSTTARQDLIEVGDIIKEVNDEPVRTAEELGQVIQRSNHPDVQFRVVPARMANGVDNKVIYVGS